MSAVTESPWEYRQIIHFSNPGEVVCLDVVGNHGKYICTVSKEMEAEARLIASAPEILKVLEELLAEKDDYIVRKGLGNPFKETLSQKARDVIFKAKGEQP